MSKKEIILSEASREMIPEAIRADDYYAANDQSVQQEYRIKEEIAALAQDMEPWQVQVARLYARGESQNSIAKHLKKAQESISKALKTLPVQQLTHYYVHLQIYQDGPNEALRKKMLWRIAVDNEKADPKESIKALAELNRMVQNNRSSGGFNIVINGVNLAKGPLDV